MVQPRLQGGWGARIRKTGLAVGDSGIILAMKQNLKGNNQANRTTVKNDSNTGSGHDIPDDTGESQMNLPNLITLFRIFLIPVFMIVLLIRIPCGDYLAAGVFIIAAATDSLDGYIARKRKQVTKLGIILDPLADKLLITAALISLVELGRVAAWIAVVILGREFAVTGLRAIKAEEGVIIPAGWLGKVKTVSQIIAIILVILEGIYSTFIPWPIGDWAMYVAVAFTLVSGIEYFWRWW